MIKEITSTSNPLIKELASLSTKEKKERNLVIIEGNDLVELAYEKSCLDYLFVLEENSTYKDIDQYITSEAVLKKLSSNNITTDLKKFLAFPYEWEKIQKASKWHN